MIIAAANCACRHLQDANICIRRKLPSPRYYPLPLLLLAAAANKDAIAAACRRAAAYAAVEPPLGVGAADADAKRRNGADPLQCIPLRTAGLVCLYLLVCSV